MTPFTTLRSVVAPLLRDNIDTDTIIPSREMTSTGRTGLGDGLFAPWRYIAGRQINPEFVLNMPQYASARIIASGVNFGCGSSREHAVWALGEFGIGAIIAESFAPIFRNNAVRNGLLSVVMAREDIAAIAGQTVSIDLERQVVSSDVRTIAFEIDEEVKMMLLSGLDAIDLTLTHAPAIAAFHARDAVARPWVYLGSGT